MKLAMMTIFVWIAFAVNAMAATFSVWDLNPDENGNPRTTIKMVGETEEGDFQRFIDAIERTDRFVNGKKVEAFNGVIWLQGPGGLKHVGMKIANEIRSRGLWTAVPRETKCASACAMMWMAGVERASYPTSEIGFHFGFLQIESLDQLQSSHGWFGVQHVMKEGSVEDTLFFIDMGLKDRDGFFNEMSFTPNMWWTTQEQREDLIGSHMFD